MLDQPATSAALAGQEWDIALALREQAALRAKRAELSTISGGARTSDQARAISRAFRDPPR